jgi:hypothetical protein
MFILCHCDDTYFPHINNNITYKSKNNVLLNAMLNISLTKIKQAICREFE